MLLKNLTVQALIAAVLAVLMALFLVDSPVDKSAPPAWYEFILMLKTMFLAALRMLIAPMIFFSLLAGIASIGSVLRLRTLGATTLFYYLGTTGVAIALGLVAVFLIHPWTAWPPAPELAEADVAVRMIDAQSGSMIVIIKQFLSLALTNPFTALVELNILGIVTNAFLIGLAMVIVLPADSPVFALVADANRIIIKVLGWVIRLLPIGIFAILFDFTLSIRSGDGQFEHILSQLLAFGGLVVALTLFHGLVVLPAIAWWFTRRSPIALLRDLSRPIIVAFSTSSSAATLPVSMRTADETLKVRSSTSSFVLPLGATINMDGTALFEAVAAIFLAYLFDVPLGPAGIVLVFLMSMVASIGAPGMPSGSMAGMQLVLLAVGIPLEAIAILLVIERPLDTIRTSLNVEGDLVGALVIDEVTAGQGVIDGQSTEQET
ncbi:MAG: hypothetical protein CBB92_00285 [Flammeovirgaceae bacterium TMED32]|nr:MAG: hypothetical protein CBB92_02845 [Flammeovirgaceae bacterium TMED32]OUU04364.1 MAG: hypothetical protein CBB92_00285 [Flammeovirgaceae bacterium TMED32]|tara:strand:- start:14957 stop:16258 length:1302 start_codon:yes stop_codon:yes gene_type:complete